MAFSLYRRPAPRKATPMRFLSWLRSVKSGFAQQRAGRPDFPRRAFTPSAEALEDRTLPAVNFMTLAANLNTSLTALSGQLATIDNSNVLPVANLPLASIPSAGDLMASFQSTVVTTV